MELSLPSSDFAMIRKGSSDPLRISSCGRRPDAIAGATGERKLMSPNSRKGPGHDDAQVLVPSRALPVRLVARPRAHPGGALHGRSGAGLDRRGAAGPARGEGRPAPGPHAALAARRPPDARALSRSVLSSAAARYGRASIAGGAHGHEVPAPRGSIPALLVHHPRRSLDPSAARAAPGD